jgi:hypothetical protein
MQHKELVTAFDCIKHKRSSSSGGGGGGTIITRCIDSSLNLLCEIDTAQQLLPNFLAPLITCRMSQNIK